LLGGSGSGGYLQLGYGSLGSGDAGLLGLDKSRSLALRLRRNALEFLGTLFFRRSEFSLNLHNTGAGK
jgi:hypothetical protein